MLPPQSKTRVNSHTPPPDTMSVDASWPIATTTVAVSVALRCARILRLHESAEQAERLEVDSRKLQAGALRGLGVWGNLVARCDDEQDPPRRLAARRLPLVEHAIVEHRLAAGDRQDLVGLETYGVVESCAILDTGDLEGADADAVARNADADVLHRQLVVGEECAERVGQRFRVADLAVDDDSGLERRASQLDELGSPVLIFDDCGCELRGSDLQADDLATAALVATA